jgi:hypothetical protein
MRLRYSAACLLVAAALGCGGAQFVPVSGVVKMNDKPYAGAAVSFQPIGDKDNPNPGRGSSAITDENGRFVLKCDNEIDGAVVGKHLVRIRGRSTAPVGEPGIGSPDGGAPAKPSVDDIPAAWRDPGKEFTVPPAGTDKADFDIKSK